MRKYKSIQKLLAIALVAVSLTACSEDTMDKINNDPNHPKNTQAKFLVADLIASTAFQVTGADLSTYSSVYIEQETGVHNQLYNAECRIGEPSRSTTYSNSWNTLYSNVKNAKIVIAKCSKGGIEEGNDITLAVAKILLAYNMAVLTDLFGDVPYVQAGEINSNNTPKYLQPKIDTQKDIYTAVMNHLDEAIVLLDGKDAGLYGPLDKKDFIFEGETKLWKKAAYAMKARYTMHLLNTSADKAGDLEKILDYISKSFEKDDKEFQLAVYDGASAVNPLYAFNSSRDALGASESLLKKFTDRNDPRANEAFMDYTDSPQVPFAQVTDPAKIATAPNGVPVQKQYSYSISVASYAITAPTKLLSYHELLFLKAEALCRLDRSNLAEPVLKEAITVAFGNLANTITSATGVGASVKTTLNKEKVATDYFDASVKPLFTANPLKETMVQKYLAFFGASGEAIEAYNDFRRMKAMNESFIELKNKNNTDKFPLRFGYGTNDVVANNEIKTAFGNGQYVYTEQVWWAGGTR